MTLPRTLGKMSTTIEKVFRMNREGYYVEIHLHFLNFLNEDGSLRSSKIDREIVTGRIWKKAKPGERSLYGEEDYIFPNESKPTRLLCISR
jgi:hypothetical protein